jgi:hypothetical protein
MVIPRRVVNSGLRMIIKAKWYCAGTLKQIHFFVPRFADTMELTILVDALLCNQSSACLHPTVLRLLQRLVHMCLLDATFMIFTQVQM